MNCDAYCYLFTSELCYGFVHSTILCANKLQYFVPEFDNWYSKCFLQTGDMETSASAGFGVRPGISVPHRLLLRPSMDHIEDDQVCCLFNCYKNFVLCDFCIVFVLIVIKICEASSNYFKFWLTLVILFDLFFRF